MITEKIKENIANQEKEYSDILKRMKEIDEEFKKLSVRKIQLEATIIELRNLLKGFDESNE